MECEVLFHRNTSWRVGETKAERVQRMRDRTPVPTAERYPDNYTGRVIAVRPVRDVVQKRRPSLRKMQSKDWGVVVLNLDAEARSELGSRREKIIAGRREPVTFEDRHGAISAPLRNVFGSTEAAETAEAKAEDHYDIDGRRFEALQDIARRNLAPTITNTGTGLYAVKETPASISSTQEGPVDGQVVTLGGGEWTVVAPQLSPTTIIRSLVEFDGKLYGGTSNDGRLLEWNGTDAWIEAAPQLNAETLILDLVVHNSKIYGSTGPNGKLHEWNGTDAWVEVAPQLGAETSIPSLIVHNGKIYGGTQELGKLYEWNGTNAWVEVAPQLNSQTRIFSLGVFGGDLYGGTSPGGRLFKWNGTNAWTQVAPQLNSQTAVRSLIEFEGDLYGGTSSNGKLFQWNGTNAWVEVADQLNSQTDIFSLVIFNSELYGTTTGGSRLFKWNGTDAWVQVADQVGIETHVIPAVVFNSSIYSGTASLANLVRFDEGPTLDTDYTGGYVLNVTRSETRAIISHTSDTTTLEGSLSSWLADDVLTPFDSWSTIQAAIDQLTTDQGATVFAAEQRVEIYDGTYDEIISMPTIAGQATKRMFLVAATGESAVIVTNISTANHPIASITTNLTIQDIEIQGVRGGFTEIVTDKIGLRVIDCVLDGTSTGLGGISRISTAGPYVSGTTIKNHLGIGVATYGPCTIRGCTFENNAQHIEAFRWSYLDVSGSSFKGGTIGIWTTGHLSNNQQFRTMIRNCTFYDVDFPISTNASVNNRAFQLECHNNIFQGATNVYNGDYEGGYFDMDYNIYFNNTAICDTYQGATKTTLVQWQAVTDDFGNSPDANSLAVDPLMTNPGAGDFSLGTGSPAIWAGRGSGVLVGVNAVAFDNYHPDIGGWSSGVLPASTLNISAIAPNFDGDSFTLTVANTLGLAVNVYTSPAIPAAFALDAETRVGDGDLTPTGKTANALYYVYAVHLIGNTIAGVSNVVKVLITTTDSGGLPEDVDEDLSVLPGVDLLLREDTHDLARADRDIVTVDGSLLVRQRLAVALPLFKGEWFLDAEAGVPWLQEILEKGVSTPVVDAIIRDKIINTPGVNRILVYSSEIDATARTVSVDFTVDSVYGPVEFEGALL